MAIALKLEIYKIRLFNRQNGKPVTFREFFRNKLAIYSTSTTITENDIFSKYYTDLLNTIDISNYHGNDKRKKGFTVYKEDIDGKRQSFMSGSSKDWTISGILQGGKYDRLRILGKFDDTLVKQPIERRNIICDRFYFLLNVVLQHNEGIVMIQSYNESNISDVLRDFLVTYFSNSDVKAQIETYVPDSLKQKYLNSSEVKSLSFSTIWKVNPGFEETTQDEYDIQLKVEIVDKGKKKLDVDSITKLFEAFKGTRVSVSKDQYKDLDSFTQKKAKIGDGRKASTVDIDFDKDDNIKLSVPLSDFNIHPDENGIPDFESIKVYTRSLLDEIIKELRPKNGIKDL